MRTHRPVMVDWRSSQGLSVKSEENVALINDVCCQCGEENVALIDDVCCQHEMEWCHPFSFLRREVRFLVMNIPSYLFLR